MNFNDRFQKAYKQYVDDQNLPNGLNDRIINGIASSEKASGITEEKISPRVRPSRRIRLFALAPAAALLVLALIPLTLSVTKQGDFVAVHESNHEDVQQNDAGIDGVDSLLEESGFVVKAYAVDERKPLVMPGKKNLVLFKPNGVTGDTTYWLDENDNMVYADFLSETFTIEGDNIVRVQIHLSDGELYAQTTEQVDFRKNPDLYLGEEGLPPRLRGKLKNFDKCDAVGTAFFTAPDAPSYSLPICRNARMKRIGSVIDAKKTDDIRVGTDQIQFGLIEYIDDPFFHGKVLSTEEIAGKDGSTLSEDADAYRRQYEGKHLTVTVTFDDGHCETQVLELHQGVIACDEDENIIEPIRFFDCNKGDVLGELIMYGTILSVTDEKFPYSDLVANEFADKVMPAVEKDMFESYSDDEIGEDE